MFFFNEKKKELRSRYSLDQVEFIQNNMPYNNNKIKQMREIFPLLSRVLCLSFLLSPLQSDES